VGTQVTAAQSPQVDICFVVDTTGSMSDKINALIRCMTDFVGQLGRLNLDWRTTCVPFGDLTVRGDRIVSDLPFVNSVKASQAQLRGMERFSGGGNTGESSIEAMQAGLRKAWRTRAVRVVVLLTDEPALRSKRAFEVNDELTSQEAICFVASPPHKYFQSWAHEHGGVWYEISARLETRQLLNLLNGLVADVARVAHEVHALARGSVRSYLALPEASRRSLPR
jgi:hypothetical protein